jgi:hypothetical protein
MMALAGLVLGVGTLVLMRWWVGPVAGELVRPRVTTRWAAPLIRWIAPAPETGAVLHFATAESQDSLSGWILFRSEAEARQAADLVIENGTAQVAVACTVAGPEVCAGETPRVELCRLRGEPRGAGPGDDTREWPGPCGRLAEARAVLVFFVAGATSPAQQVWRQECHAQACKELYLWERSSTSLRPSPRPSPGTGPRSHR